MMTGIRGITQGMGVAAGHNRAGVAVLVPGTMMIVRITGRGCAWAAGREARGRSVTSTGSSIVMVRADQVTAVADRVMHQARRVLIRVVRVNTRVTPAVVRVTAVADRVMHPVRRVLIRVARMNTRVVRVMVVAVQVLHHPIARAGASESNRVLE
jgi:hypothetical protein